MKEERLTKLLSECLFYLDELKERDSKEERESFFMGIIGLTPEELKEFDIEV